MTEKHIWKCKSGEMYIGDPYFDKQYLGGDYIDDLDVKPGKWRAEPYYSDGENHMQLLLTWNVDTDPENVEWSMFPFHLKSSSTYTTVCDGKTCTGIEDHLNIPETKLLFTENAIIYRNDHEVGHYNVYAGKIDDIINAVCIIFVNNEKKERFKCNAFIMETNVDPCILNIITKFITYIMKHP